MKKLLLAAVVFIFMLTSCGDGDDNTGEKNDSETSDKTEVEDEVDNEVQDEDRKEDELKKEPGDDFYEPKLHLTMEFEGMINSEEDAQNNSVTNGIASLNLDFNGNKEDAFTAQPFTYITKVKEESALGDSHAGKDLLVGGFFSDDIKQEDGFVKYKALYFGMLVEPLRNAKESKEQIISLDGLDFINYMTVQYKKRADGVVVRRSCLLAVEKDGSSDSKYFLDFSGSGNYEPGDNLHFFANLELDYDEEDFKENGLEEDEGLFCTYKMDGEDISKAEYEVEVEKTGVELSCELPESFETPPEDNYVDMLFKGEITSSDNVKGDLGVTNLVLHGEKITVDDYQSSAYIWTDENGKKLIIEAMGGVKAISGNEHLEFKVSRFIFPYDTLSEVFTDGDETCHIIYSTENLIHYSYEVDEQKTIDGNYNMKACTKAIPAKESTFFDAFFCTKGNTDFSEGESIEMRAIVNISDDEEWLKEVYEVESLEEICLCYNADGIFDCSEYDSLGE